MRVEAFLLVGRELVGEGSRRGEAGESAQKGEQGDEELHASERAVREPRGGLSQQPSGSREGDEQWCSIEWWCVSL